MLKIQSWKNSVSVFSNTYSYLQKLKLADQNIEELKRAWAQEMLRIVKIECQVQGIVSSSKSVLFVGNHISYLDIPLLMAHVPDLSFVAKEEVQSWPLIGLAAKKINTVFVKRENMRSRLSARKCILDSILSGRRITIFPSGTTCISELKPWRTGPFKIAYATKCLIQPFRISYSAMRTAAYIDNDFFPLHLLNVCGNKSLTAKLEFHNPIRITDPIEDCKKWHEWSKALNEN